MTNKSITPYKYLPSNLLGKPIFRPKKINIIGAGISGMLLGFYLKKKGIPFVIYEKEKRAGGLLGTKQSSHGLVEQAANGFLWCAELAEVCKDIGADLIPPQETAKARFLLKDKVPKKMPLSILEIIQTGFRFLGPKKTQPTTVKEFGLRYFGTAFTNQILEPAFGGIYGCGIDKLSYPAVLKILAKNHHLSTWMPLAMFKGRGPKSAIKKPGGTHSLKQGMGELTAKLALHLQDHIQYDCNGFEQLSPKDEVIITTPAYQAASFFKGRLKELLTQVEYTPIISVTLFFDKSSLGKFKPGFGCLIPRSENLLILGVLFNDQIFEGRTKDENTASLTCILRDDTENQEWMNRMPVDIKNHILQELDLIFDLSAPPLDYHLVKWPKGIPVYSPKLYQDWFEMDRILQANYPNVRLYGNYTGEISVRGMATGAKKVVGE